jgi:four helix bundle protein
LLLLELIRSLYPFLTWSLKVNRTNFEKLQVYKLAEELADGIWPVVLTWDYLAKDTVGKQIIRSADSIGANIAEGTGKGTFQDNRRYIRMARGSLYETQHWLRRSYKRGLLNQQQVESLKTILNELSPKLHAYFRAINNAAVIGKNKVQSTKYKAQKAKS